MRLPRSKLFLFLQVVLLVSGVLNAEAEDKPACYLNVDHARAGGERLSSTTGVPWMDHAFSTELGYLRSAFGVMPTFFTYDDSEGPNAQASPNITDPGKPDGTVIFGLTLLKSQLDATGQFNNFTVPAIMAHEFTHIVQYKFNEHLPTMLLELEADYMAGWYLSSRSGKSPIWSPIAAKESLEAFYRIGDYDFNSPGHHGTPEQRIAALSAGMRYGGTQMGFAFRSAARYVRTIPTGSASAVTDGHVQLATPDRTQEGADEFRTCMQRRITSCMRDCVRNYGYPPNQCKNHYCSPTVGSNRSWADRCRSLSE